MPKISLSINRARGVIKRADNSIGFEDVDCLISSNKQIMKNPSHPPARINMCAGEHPLQLKHFSCGMFIKDAQGIYAWVNEALLKRHQLSYSEILGKKDAVLPWASHTKMLRLHDEEVFDKKAATVFKETISRKGQDIDGYCHKSPIYDSNAQLIGVAGIFIDAPSSKNTISPVLSMRERQCLHNLAQGMTALESAQLLKLSRRTVEGYLEQMRLKYHCRNQAELLTFYFEKCVNK